VAPRYRTTSCTTCARIPLDLLLSSCPRVPVPDALRVAFVLAPSGERPSLDLPAGCAPIGAIISACWDAAPDQRPAMATCAELLEGLYRKGQREPALPAGGETGEPVGGSAIGLEIGSAALSEGALPYGQWSFGSTKVDGPFLPVADLPELSLAPDRPTSV